MTHFDLCRSYGFYEDPLRKVLHRFKYGKRTRLGSRLAGLLYEQWLTSPCLHQAEILLPAPLHHRRQRARGFNQSKLLAKHLSQMIHLPLESRALERTRNTASQTGLSPRQRRLNVSGAFRVRKPASIRGRNCLLIDDVFTTGATLNEMARVLSEAGANKVLALTLARVSPRGAFVTPKVMIERSEP